MKNDYSIRDGVAHVQLTQGQTCLIDESDLPLIAPFRWCALWDGDTRSYYAAAHVPRPRRPGKWTTLLMHRLLLGLEFDDRRHADHVNHSTLDNRGFNLRVATVAQNNQNSRKRRDNSSGFTGVYWKKETQRWRACIGINGNLKHLGYFDSRIDAAKAYDAAALKFHGEFATLNFPKESTQ